MKKSFFLSLVFLFIFSLNAFCVSGFELGINVPLLGGLNFDSIELKRTTPNSIADSYYNSAHGLWFGFNSGVLIQAGYTIGIGKIAGTFLAEFGYSHDDLAFRDFDGISGGLGGISTDTDIKTRYIFESIQIGILPKININNFCIGVGAGIKIPVSGRLSSKGFTKTESGGNVTITDINQSEKIDIGKTFKTPVMPYVKMTFDYSIFFTPKTAIVLGLQLGYNFGINFKTADQYIVRRTLSSFEFGGQIGFRFGQKL